MKKIVNLTRRSALFRAIREYFYDQNFIEVETPVKIHAPAPEEFIEAVPANGAFLRTSPELEMKSLLVDGFERIFQIGPCFRANEYGRKHHEEFTMLEFYIRGMEYRSLAKFTAGFIAKAASLVLKEESIIYRGHKVDLAKFEFITVEEAFERYAGGTWQEADRQDKFDELMVTKIEPMLGRGQLTFLIDYPANRASLARLCPDNSAFAERWELYIEGIELANAFGELTDFTEQKKRFKEAQDYRNSRQMAQYPEATEFFAALKRGLPQSSGCAMGLDRLTMIFCDAEDINEVCFSY